MPQPASLPVSAPLCEFELFEQAPVPLWESDYSAVKDYFKQDWAKNIDDMEMFLLENPNHFVCCMQKIRVINLNQATLRLFKATSKQQLILGLEQVYMEEGMAAFAKVLAQMYYGDLEGCCRNQMQDLAGIDRSIDIHWSVPPQYAHSLQRVIVATTLVNEVEKEEVIKTRSKIELLPDRFQKHALQRAFDVLENIPDLVGYGDFMTNRATYMNAAGRKMLGIEPDENITQYNIAQFHKPEFYEVVEQEIMPLINAGKVWTGQSEFVSLSGEVIPIIQMIIPHYTSDGQLHGTSTIAKDLRAIKKAEAELLEQRNELATLYRLHSMSEVASSIAHEINQPLTALTNYAHGCLHRLKSRNVSDDIVKGVQHIVEQAKRAGDIVHHIKNYLSRGVLHNQPIDVNQLVKESVKYTNLSFTQESALQVEYQLAAALPVISGDALYLRQVFVNLINNAVDALVGCEQANKIISIRTELGSDSNVIISIVDNGIGMSKEQQTKIFTPLYSSKPKGTGIGLALVRYIVEQHGGNIKVCSKPQQGSQFIVSLLIDSKQAY